MRNLVKNIIFDLGGVIINLDYQKTADAFRKLGASSFDVIYNQKKQEHLFDDFEKGILSEADFRNEIRKHLREGVADEMIDSAWNAMLLDVPTARMEMLQLLAGNYRIFLLSNTNIIHVKSFSAALDKQYGSKAFDKVFEKVYYSCFMNMRKPDSEIFEKVIKENNLDAGSTIFIDDSPQHVKGAHSYGITSYLLEKDADVQHLLRSLSLIS
jgi:glucose-1-phosphatase